MGITAGGDFLGLCDEKVHINTCPTLDSYGVTGIFKLPYTPSCEPRFTRRARGGNVLAGLSFALQALFLPPHSPTQLQTVQFPYLDTWKLFKERGEAGVGGYSHGQCTPISLTLQ